MNPEFENLLRLLESTDEANVRLGLQLARNYEAEVEAYFGNSRQDLEALFEFLMEYEAWDFKTAFWEVTSVSFYRRHIQPLPIGLLENLSYLEICGMGLYALQTETLQLEFFDYQRYSLPTEIWKLKNLRCLVLKDNNLTTLPAEIGKLKSLKELVIRDNSLHSLPKELCEIENLKIYFEQSPDAVYIPECLRDSCYLFGELYSFENRHIVQPLQCTFLWNDQ